MHAIYTLQEFMLHTKNVVYILIVTALVVLPMFWAFLNSKDEK